LSAFLPRLTHRSVIDVGAERGSFAVALLGAGSDEVHVIEPEADNSAVLDHRFEHDQRVTVHRCAVSATDGVLHLYTSVAPDGTPVTFGHTVLDLPDTDAIRWRAPRRVEARSLASLVDAGEIPAHAGILKVDTEGHDLAVVAGMGDLEADVVMVEHWTDLPLTLGRCPWTSEEMVSELLPRGFSHFAFVVHLEDFVFLQWDDGAVPRGYMGNLVFLHDRVLEDLVLPTLEVGSSFARDAARVVQEYVTIASERLAQIDEISRSRLALVEEISRSRLGRRVLSRIAHDAQSS